MAGSCFGRGSSSIFLIARISWERIVRTGKCVEIFSFPFFFFFFYVLLSPCVLFTWGLTAKVASFCG